MWLLAVALVGPLVLVGHRGPGVVGIEQLHLAEFIEGFDSEILLVDDAVLTDNEGLHAGDTIFSGRRNQGEAPDHYAFNHEVHLTKRRRRALALQNLEEISVVRFRLEVISLLDGLGDFFADRAAPATIRILPGEAVLRAGRADDALRVLVHVVTLARLESV